MQLPRTWLALLFAGLSPAVMAEAPSVGETCYLDGWHRPLLCHRLALTDAPERPELAVMVAPAVSETDEEPLYLLAGGPGQAASDLAPLLQALEPVNRQRDIVMVDRRGSGRSGAFRCDIDEQLSISLEEFAQGLAGCYLARPEFADSLSSRQTVDDLEMVRRALGHERVALWGGSWGTRTALLYQQWYPESLSELVLDAVAPIETKVFLTAQAAEKALRKLERDCSRDPACARLGDWREQLDQLLAEWDSGAAHPIPDPLTGQPAAKPMARWELANGIRAMLYDPVAAAQLPFAVTQASRGNFAPLAGLSGAFIHAADSMAMGLTFSVACAEELNRITAAEVAADSRDSFLGTAFYDLFRRGCDEWPVREKPYREPAPRDHPVLLISGEADPITPPRYAEEALDYLEDKQHLVVAGGGHINSRRGCIPRLIADFLAEPSSKLDVSCIDSIRRPPFMAAEFGPDLGAVGEMKPGEGAQ